MPAGLASLARYLLDQVSYCNRTVVTTRAQYSVRKGKEMVRRVVAGQLTEDAETTAIRNGSFDTPDYAEGVRAFLEKRPPRFTWT